MNLGNGGENVSGYLDRKVGEKWRKLPIRVRAPGRVNLIGDHTDYNEGFVLPAAIQLECVIAARSADQMALRTLNVVEEGWTRYVDAVAAELGGGALEGYVASSVPPGSGLSSSAALEVACAVALRPDLPRLELALACQRAEHAATGVPSGLMDQLAALYGERGKALLIDCRTNEIRPVALPAELALLVVHSGLPRRLETSAYAARRRECELVARELGVRSLRDATLAEVRERPVARHVVSENSRVLAAVDAISRRDYAGLGRLFLESHASLRDDYRVSTPELDELVDAFVRCGAYGARLTGAGFGGCVVGISDRANAAEIVAATADRYAMTTRLTPTAWLCEASPGAGPLEAAS
jgi:galactokinase